MLGSYLVRFLHEYLGPQSLAALSLALNGSVQRIQILNSDQLLSLRPETFPEFQLTDEQPLKSCLVYSSPSSKV